MPKLPESSQPIQGIDATPAVSVPFKDLPKKSLSKFPISDELTTYIVCLVGEWSDKRASVQWIFKAKHPLLALGEAMLKFSKDYFMYSINHWSIAAPYTKQSRKTKNRQETEYR